MFSCRSVAFSQVTLLSVLCLSVSFLALSAKSSGQIEPERVYNGVNRSFDLKVRAPRGAKKIEIRLLAAMTSDGKAAVLQSAPIKLGNTDLSRTLDGFWKDKPKEIRYLQLVVDDKPLGAAIVLQPMTNPRVATLATDGKGLLFSPDEDRAFSGYRAYVDQTVVMETTLGNIEFRMRPDCAPNTVWNLLELVKGGFYREIIWHRVVAKRADGTPFVIQAGDPTGTGSGSPGYSFVLEKSPLEHTFGVLSMARSTDPNTNGSQFFVGLSREGTKHLDNRYASFGEAISGSEVIIETAKVAVGAQDRPVNPPVIRRIVLRPALPYGTGPSAVKRPL